MMKKLILSCSLAAALAFGGCAQFQTAANWLASPTATADLANLQKFNGWAVCAINNLAAVAVQVEAAVQAGKAAQDITGKVYTATTIVCGALGGQVTGTVSAQ